MAGSRTYAKAAVRPMAPVEQVEVRQLVLAGLAERWGELDDSLNRDLDDVAASFAVTLTARLADRLVGTGSLALRHDAVAEVLRMSTAANARGRGVAAAVLLALVGEARRRGCRTVVLETSADWVEARRLYERHGFVLVGESGGDAHYRLALE